MCEGAALVITRAYSDVWQWNNDIRREKESPEITAVQMDSLRRLLGIRQNAEYAD